MSSSRLFGHTAIGKNHIHEGLPNQDAVLCKKGFIFPFGPIFSMAVISDGMGSKKFADIGSQVCCKAVEKSIHNFLKRKNRTQQKVGDFLENVVENWKVQLGDKNYKDCSATCLFAFATKRKIFVAMLGDGMICILPKNTNADDVFLLQDLKDEDFVNATHSLSSSNHLKYWQVKTFDIKDVKAIFLCTDGISSDLKDNFQKEFFIDLYADIGNKKNNDKKNCVIKLVEDWNVKGHGDDKTLALIEFA